MTEPIKIDLTEDEAHALDLTLEKVLRDATDQTDYICRFGGGPAIDLYVRLINRVRSKVFMALPPKLDQVKAKT